MTYLQQPTNQSLNFDDNEDSSKIKKSLPSIITQQSSLKNALPEKNLNGPSGIRGGGACFDCLAAICCCCAIEDCCCDCCKNL